MDSDQQHDLFRLDGASHSFDVVRRGYDRAQVHDMVDRLDGELRVALADKDASAARAAELASHLAGVQAEMESLRRKAQSAGVPNFESMGARISHMLKLAEEEANDIRRLAQEDTTRSRAELDSTAEETARIRAEVQDEARRVVEEAQDAAAKTIADAQKHADEVNERARASFEQAEGESKARVAKVEEDFHLAQKARRAEAARVEQERDQSSRRDAQTRIAQAQGTAGELVSVAEQRVADLDGRRTDILTRLTQIRELLAGLPELEASGTSDSAEQPGTAGTAAPSPAEGGETSSHGPAAGPGGADAAKTGASPGADDPLSGPTVPNAEPTQPVTVLPSEQGPSRPAAKPGRRSNPPTQAIQLPRQR